MVKATSELGLPENHVRVLHYPVRRFPEFRQDILENIIELKRELDPGIVMCPSRFDIHQDYRVIADETVRAFKDRTILGYETPWNSLSITTSCFCVLEEGDIEGDIERKNAALQCYMSQGSRGYINLEFIYDLSRVRGAQIGVHFAEVFEVVRVVFD